MVILNTQRWGRDEVILHPGEIHASSDQLISTVLGTCVSVILYSPEKNIGGMNHIMLPGTGALHPDQPGKYGKPAIDILIDQLLSFSLGRDDLKAKVFGGGDMFSQYPEDGELRIGQRNVEYVFQILDEYNIEIEASDVCGLGGRKITFVPWLGKVFLRRIGRGIYDPTRFQFAKFPKKDEDIL